MDSADFASVVADELRSRGGRLEGRDGSPEVACELATPFGLVRVGSWRQVVVARLLSFPKSQTNWYGFERWKETFSLWKEQPEISREEFAQRLAEWVDRYYVAAREGFPNIEAVYNVRQVLCLSRRHTHHVTYSLLSKFVRVGVDTFVNVQDMQDQEVPAWLEVICRAAALSGCEWVCFRPGLKPDPRFTVF